MQFLVSAVSTALKQEEKYQNIPRDRWAKWREKLHEDMQRKQTLNNSPLRKPADSLNKPRKIGAIVTQFTTPDDQMVATLFAAKLLTSR